MTPLFNCDGCDCEVAFNEAYRIELHKHGADADGADDVFLWESLVCEDCAPVRPRSFSRRCGDFIEMAAIQ